MHCGRGREGLAMYLACSHASKMLTKVGRSPSCEAKLYTGQCLETDRHADMRVVEVVVGRTVCGPQRPDASPHRRPAL